MNCDHWSLIRSSKTNAFPAIRFIFRFYTLFIADYITIVRIYVLWQKVYIIGYCADLAYISDYITIVRIYVLRQKVYIIGYCTDLAYISDYNIFSSL